ncbi:MAG: hypothetical protein KC589_03925 [Nanoarchaeota archaeon]|nr:hypothetical protein [Nanoarchaeota archaeon]
MILQHSVKVRNHILRAFGYDNEKPPEIDNKKNRLGWINWGKSNHFPDELLDVFYKSSIHNAIIESRVRMIVGDGFEQDIENDEEFSDQTQLFIDACNPYESLEDIFIKISNDYEIYGCAFLQVVLSKDKKRIANIYHIDSKNIRLGNIEKGILKSVYFSEDWKNYRKSEYLPEEIPVFDDNSKESIQIIPIIRYSPGMKYYPIPDYYGALTWIKIDIEIGKYQLNNIQNGYHPTLFLSMPVGNKTDEEMEQIMDEFYDKYSGSNGEKLIGSFWDGDESDRPKIETIQLENAVDLFKDLRIATQQQILVGHKVSDENLVGISTPGKLGNKNNLINDYEVYFKTVVYPEQQKLLKVLQRIFLFNGFNDIKIINNTPFNYSFSEQTLSQILTKNELRDMIGYESIDGGDAFSPTPTTTLVDINRNDFVSTRTINKDNYSEVIPEANLDDIYVWKVGPGENCPSCKERDGVSRTLDEWTQISIPGCPDGELFNMFDDTQLITNYPHTPYGSFCEANCNCKLQKIGSKK